MQLLAQVVRRPLQQHFGHVVGCTRRRPDQLKGRFFDDVAADIINLSLGGAPFSQTTQNLVDQVRAAGVLLVAAALERVTHDDAFPLGWIVVARKKQ